jgi:hypothetical protein
MATKLTLEHRFTPESIGLNPKFTNGFFAEEPVDVLKNLAAKYNVLSYMGIRQKLNTFERVKVNQEDTKKISRFVPDYFDKNNQMNMDYGLKIEGVDESNLSSLSVTKTLDSLDLSFLLNAEEPHYLKEKDKFVGGLIRNHLIKLELSPVVYGRGVYDFAYLDANRLYFEAHKIIIKKHGKQRVSEKYPTVKAVHEYLKERHMRHTKQNPELEQKLKYIAEFASAIYGREININFLETLPVDVPKIGQPVLF